MTRPLVAAVLAGTVTIAGHAQSQRVAVRGHVASAETGDALAHARVIIYNDAMPFPAIFTDGAGRFASQPLPASGRYRLSVTKAGYALTNVAKPDLNSDVEVRMPRAAAISGRVVDQFGEPSAGVPVSLFQDQLPATGVPGPPGAALIIGGFKRVTTDDLGEYRFGGLKEGTYFVASITTRQDDTGRFVQAATYFPGVTTPAEAQSITLKPGDERTGVDVAGVSSQADAFNVTSGIVLQGNNVILVGPSGTPTTPRPIMGTGVIRGTVTRSDGLPLSHATVSTTVPETMVGQTRLSGRKSVQTDEDGRYEFTDLPKGQYRINAAKLGYTSSTYGEALTGERPVVNFQLGTVAAPGTPVDLAEGQIKTRIDIALSRYSALTGRVLDEYGDPVENVTVNAAQIRFAAGRRRLANIGLTRPTDDLGRYRLYGYQPGQYIIYAAPGQVVPNQPASDLSGYAPTYFPGTPNPATAQLIQVSRSQDVTALDFVLAPTPTATISGKKLGSDGEPLGGSLMLMESQRSGGIITPATGARIYDDGRFEFPNVAPGDYVIQADRHQSAPGVEGEFAAQFVTVSGSDVPDLLLKAAPGSTISGRVIFDGDGPPPSIRTLAILPDSADLDRTPNGSLVKGDVQQDLTFQIAGVHGPRRIEIDRPPKGWDLKSVVANGVDITDASLMFDTPEQSLTDVQVTLTNRLTEIVGTVVNSRGEPTRDYTMLVFPQDRERWYTGSRYFRRASPEPSGVADVRGLPQGDYFVAPVFGMSVLRDGFDAWQDPEFLESIAPRAVQATLNDGQRLSISARLIDR